MKTQSKKKLRQRIRAFRQGLADGVSPPPEIPEAARYGLSIHDGSALHMPDPRALDMWDNLAAPILDPDAPKTKRPAWFRKIGPFETVTREVADFVREREEAGYMVVFTVKDTPDRAAISLRMLEERRAMPTVFGIGNEPDLGKKRSAKEIAKTFREDGSLALLERVQGEHGLIVANPGLQTFSHALADYGRMWGDVFAGFSQVMAKVHDHGNFQPKYWEIMQAKRALLRNMGLPATSLVAVEESGNGFLGHLEEANFAKTEEVTGIQAGDYAYASFLAACQSEMFAGHFLLDHHTINAISHPVYGLQRFQGFQRAMQKIKRTGSVGTVLDLEMPNPKGKELDVAALLAGMEPTG